MTTTSYLELDDQATGANNNTWGDVADANMAILEQAIARYTSIATTGGTTTLTSSQNRYPIIKITGSLASNAIITVKTQEKNWTFINATTGSYTVTVKTSAGTGKTIPRGRAVRLYCDGTNVEYARYAHTPAAQAAGTVDAITATFEPPTTSGEIQDGTLWIVEAAGANTTTTPTFNPDGTGALTIKKQGGQALLAGDIRAAGHKLLLCYDASGGHVELLNPQTATLGANTYTGSQVISSTGNLYVSGSGKLGYDTGSGGSVTQLTSKSTGVTINRRCGQITMHNAALAAGATVSFIVTNSTISINGDDTVQLTVLFSSISGANYRVEPVHIGSGSFVVRVTNISAGSLSEALIINFNLIRMASA